MHVHASNSAIAEPSLFLQSWWLWDLLFFVRNKCCHVAFLCTDVAIFQLYYFLAINNSFPTTCGVYDVVGRKLRYSVARKVVVYRNALSDTCTKLKSVSYWFYHSKTPQYCDTMKDRKVLKLLGIWNQTSLVGGAGFNQSHLVAAKWHRPFSFRAHRINLPLQ